MRKIVFMLLIIMVAAQAAFAADQVFFYHTDPAGTPLAMTDSSGNVVWKADYKPFGEENSVTGPAANDRRFVGKEKDEETGLSYFGARYENAKIGRFVAPDPVRAVDPRNNKTNEKLLLNPQRLNAYAYALNNPYRYIDPDGNMAWDIVDFGFFAHSAYKFAKEPSWSNAGDLALNTLGLLPIVPSIGAIKMVGEGLSASKQTARLTSESLEHIIERHWATSGAKNAGKFSEGTTSHSLQGMINKAVAKGTARPNTHGRPGQIVEHDFGRTIGIDSKGNEASRLRVVTNPNGIVKTAFPY